MSQPILSVNQVSKRYGNVSALTHVSFALNSGFYALLGPNGAGKSTLFQLLTGLYAPDSGEIMVDGISIKQQLPAALAKMGVVFQQPTLDLDLSVSSNLSFHGKLHGLSDLIIRQRIHNLLEQLGLLSAANKPCRALSGGNRRKIELARALMTQPQLLLMDEATVGLDPVSRAALLAYVHQLCDTQHLCVLWATHLIDEAEQAKQVLVLHKGKLLAQASPQTLIQQTQTQHLLDAFFALSGENRSMEAKVARL